MVIQISSSKSRPIISCEQINIILTVVSMDSSPSDRVMKQYQVFLSFRGEDTRRTIVSHLHKALLDKGIDIFKDDKRLEIGDSISDEIKEAIQNSKIAVVVISENYASSTWCLNELQMIVELHKKQQLTAVPIFYDVTPSDVRHQRKTFSLEKYKPAKIFLSFFGMKTEEEEKVLKWREALTDIAGISGKVSKTCDNEAMMIEDIARRISRQLFSVEPIDLGDIVGMKTHMERLNPLLKLESKAEVRMIGIWGMGGVGKTTIAKFLYKRYSSAFAPHRCFIENVSTITGHRNLLHLQERLLSTVGEEHEKLWSVEQGYSLIKSRLRNRKVFLVIDDINNLDQLHALAKKISWFGPGSRIIVTTRDKGLLDSSGVKLLYHVSVLGNDNAIQVFNQFAFEGGQAPSDAYQRLAIQASDLAQGLPSALEDFGTYLRRMTSIDEWEKALGRLKKIPQHRIIEILRTSYEGLDRKHRGVFLHIACIFNGDSVQSVKALLEDGDIEIKALEEKSLLDISAEGYITMHALVEQAGKEFLREQSGSKLQEQTILWEHEKIIPVLQNASSTSVQSLSLHMCEMPQDVYMEGMFFFFSCIRFLKVFRHVNQTESKLQFIPETEKLPHNVLLLHWDGFPLATLPPRENLYSIVELNLRHSKLECLWDSDLRLDTLRRLDVSWSNNLKEPPNLSRATVLEELLMESCTKLERLPKSIGSLSRLKKLNLSHCDGLANIQIHISEQPVPLESRMQRRKITVNLPGEINKLSSLINLSIGGRINIQLCNLEGNADHITCISKQQIPDELMLLKNFYDFTSLNIKRTSYINDGAPFNCISFSDFPFLAELKLINLNIENIPDNIGQLQSLEKLDLSGNDFSNLPTSMKNLSKLKYARLSNCTKLEALPELTTQLQTLKLSGCTNLRSLLELSHASRVSYSLLELGLENCKSVQHLSEQLSHFKSLIHLDLSRHDSEDIPKSIRELLSVGTLCLNNCKKLKSLKDLPQKLKHLYAHGCDSLENVSLSSNHSIEHLDLSQCFSVKQEGHLITSILDDEYNLATTQFACIPENKMPSYFDNQAMGTATKIKLPPIRFTNKPLGFAACIMIACERSFDLQFPALTYDWNCEVDGIIQINLKPNIYVSSETKEEETVTSHHLVIIHVPSSINTERFDELRLESHLQLPEEFEIPPAEIRACGVRLISERLDQD